jgi:hypothetical protein
MTKTKKTRVEGLADELAQLSNKDLERVVRQAQQQKREAAATAEELAAKAKVAKIPSPTRNSLARRVKEVSEAIDFTIKLQPTIVINGNASWDLSSRQKADWDIYSVDIDWKAKGWPDKAFTTINNDLNDSLHDLIYDLDFLVDSAKVVCPPVHRLNTKITKLMADIKALEKKHKLPGNSIWNYLVDEGKI